MFEFLDKFISNYSFMPHGHCYLWSPDILWVSAVSDGLIAIAYFSIPVAIYYFGRTQKNKELRRIFELFSAFILLCGITHIMDIYTIWVPAYRLHAFFKALTAVISIYTGYYIIPFIPRFLMLKNKTRSLQDTNAQLEAASKTKSEFISNMSHEIRTPLHVLIGVADLLDDATLSEEKRKYLDIARKSGDSLLSIINNILDLSKIESGVIGLENLEIDLAELVKNTCEVFQIDIQKKNLEFKIEISQEVQNIFLGDPTRIQQILFNLISNALKFTNHGRIHVKVSKNQESHLAGNICFIITDTGVGINSEKLKGLFVPFTQADNTITRKYGGTGLGLSICKRLVELMNGSISVKSIEGQGSSFIFTLNLPFVREKRLFNQSSSVFEKSFDKTYGSGLKILVVDDSEDNRSLLMAYLKNSNHKLLEAENGLVAVELFQQIQPDLILMDIQMPIMDGRTSTRKIRELEKKNGSKPVHIWALTAFALKEDIQMNLDVGFNLHLTKPLSKAELVRQIKNLELKLENDSRSCVLELN